jgi:deazaflavin-dependent oxidoreductase (nitroreductase family)
VRPRRRRLRWWERAGERVVKSRPGAWFAIHVSNPIDRRLLRWTGGRVGVYLGQQVGLLETVGAKSGQPRTTPLLYLQDGERIVVTASSGGAARHPAWFHNVRANPDVHFSDRRGRRHAYRARVAEGAEREHLWEEVNDLYSGYETYQGRTGGRRIPVVVLEPLTSGTGS